MVKKIRKRKKTFSGVIIKKGRRSDYSKHLKGALDKATEKACIEESSWRTVEVEAANKKEAIFEIMKKYPLYTVDEETVTSP